MIPLVVGCGASDRSVDTGADVDTAAEVADALDAYLAAISARDTAAIRRAYVPDGRFVWVEDGRVVYRSADEVFEGLAAFPAGTPIRTEVDDLTVARVGRDGAHAWATFTTTVGTGPGAFSFGGAMSFVLEWDSIQWRIVGGHTSSPPAR